MCVCVCVLALYHVEIKSTFRSGSFSRGGEGALNDLFPKLSTISV